MAETWSTPFFAAAQVINMAIAYEEAWTECVNGTGEDLRLVHARDALLDAVRALKERHG